MKKTAKKFIVGILGWQVRRLRRAHDFKIIAVAGSIGKTSTKSTVAEVLGNSLRVRYQAGNYNDIVSVPLVFFGHRIPSLFNPFAWLRIFMANERQVRGAYAYDVVVVELGTDGPGQLSGFGSYLHADIGILTAITEEHMEYFSGLEGVAEEEKQIIALSDHTFANRDLCPDALLKPQPAVSFYAIRQSAAIQVTDISSVAEGMRFTIRQDGAAVISMTHDLTSETQLYALAAATAVGLRLGLDAEAIKAGIAKTTAVSGRMRRLKGINGSTIIDDTYNASPVAVKAALDTLYKIPAKQKIALLGNMNELGTVSESAHKDIGGYCDPEKLDIVLTLGPDANRHTAAAAEAKGCRVQRFDSPYAAGEYLKTVIEPGALILAKGSQNKVYAEEAVKRILADPADAAQLVRQSPDWLKKKSNQFGDA